ncbi:MAG: hypothetical protein ACIWVG_25015 [Gloeotrichia echinulata HAB0833]
MKLSIIIKSSVCVLGLVSAANLLAAPANAGQASARAATTVSRSDGTTETVSGEVVLPNGMYFGGAKAVTAVAGPPAVLGTPAGTLTVTPVIVGAGDTTETIGALAFDAGTPTSVSTLPGSVNIQSAIVSVLTSLSSDKGLTAYTGAGTDTRIQDITAIIKAAGGTSGFVGLE